MDFDPEIGYGLTASVIVVLAVQAAKFFKMPDRFAPWLAGGLSALLIGVNAISDLVPGVHDVFMSVLSALLVFLLATGLYNRGKAAVEVTGLSTQKPK